MTTDIGHVGSLFGLDEIDEVSGAVRVALLDPGPVVEGARKEVSGAVLRRGRRAGHMPGGCAAGAPRTTERSAARDESTTRGMRR
jgi:hypothetical protein